MAPTIVGTPVNTTQSSLTTSFTVNLPTGLVNDNWLFYIYGHRQSATPSATGWTTTLVATSSGNPSRIWMSYRKIDGSEGSTAAFTTDLSTRTAGVCFQVSGWDETVPPEFSSTDSGVVDVQFPDPPSLGPVSWGSADNLWLASTVNGDGTETLTAIPAGYTSLGTPSTGNAAGMTLGLVYKAATADTEDPGTFTASPGLSTARTATIALKPAGPSITSTTLATAEAPAEGVAVTPKALETLVPTSIGTPYTGLTGAVGNIQDLIDAPNGLWLTGTDPSSTSGTSGLLRPTSHAAVSGFAGEFATQASAYDTSTTTAATTTMATASSNYGNFFIFSNTVFSGIPSNATITGVELEVTDQVGTNNRSDQFYQLGTANGTLIGSEFQSDATTTKQVKTLTYANLGSPTVTRANLVSGTFGIRVRTLRSNTVTLSLFDLRMNVSYTVPGATTPIEVRALMGNPAGTLATGADTGMVRIRVRKLGSGSNPNVIAQLRDDSGNLLLDNVIPSTAVSAGDPGTVLEGTFNQNVLTAGKNSVIVGVISSGASGGLVEVGAVNWVAEDEIATGPATTTVTLATAEAPATGITLLPALDVPLQTGTAAAAGITLIPTADVPLQTGTAAATADTVTVSLGAEVTLTTAEAPATGVAIVPSADVPLQTASAASSGITLTASLDVPLQTASAATAAEALIPSADVPLQTASAAATGVTVTAAFDVPLQTATAAAEGITVTALANVDVTLQTASAAATGDAIAPVLSGQTALQTAEAGAAGIPLTVAMSTPLQTASAAATGDALTAALSIPLQTASSAATGDTLTVTGGSAGTSTTLQTASVAATSPTGAYPDAALYPGASLFPGGGLQVVVVPGSSTTLQTASAEATSDAVRPVFNRIIPLETAEPAATAYAMSFGGAQVTTLQTATAGALANPIVFTAVAPEERRLYVKFEDRSILVAIDNRIKLVPKEDRTGEVAYEGRTTAIPYENRRLVR